MGRGGGPWKECVLGDEGECFLREGMKVLMSEEGGEPKLATGMLWEAITVDGGVAGEVLGGGGGFLLAWVDNFVEECGVKGAEK